ncbi:piggyBac transposable element-derived protein 3-like [Nephila pilipes]|uniref:PiggyBac transposable element-derived protein 3-like n=1 Tax=Nephila pilipes TaxID=299642 RepID=A0A8X6JBW6_NEPPI|nr:piggyBac transposable element-derived protein 3-like [Nephila pilipes]
MSILLRAQINRTENCPHQGIKSIKKKSKGSFDFQNIKHLRVVRWNDYSVFTLSPNHYGFEPVTQTKRWLNIDKRYVDIDQPHIVSQYNKCMGGTYRMDQEISQYFCSILSKNC